MHVTLFLSKTDLSKSQRPMVTESDDYLSDKMYQTNCTVHCVLVCLVNDCDCFKNKTILFQCRQLGYLELENREFLGQKCTGGKEVKHFTIHRTLNIS